jgi:hypothetical protein
MSNSIPYYSHSMVDCRNFSGSKLRSQRRFRITRSGNDGNCCVGEAYRIIVQHNSTLKTAQTL